MTANATIPNYDTCTELTDICRVEYTAYGALFTKGACIFFAVSYALLLASQLVLGVKSRTWSFTVWLVLGTGFELLGYAARTLMVENPWRINAFIAQYLTLLLRPTLIAAAVSITFKHIVLWYGAEWSVIRPKLLPYVFVGMDLLSIAVQVLGGAIMTRNTTSDKGSKGEQKLAEALLVGGVAFQVANMLFCGALMLVSYRRRKRSEGLRGEHVRLGFDQGPQYNNLMHGKGGYSPSHQSPEAGRVRIFVWAVSVAYVAIIIRCSYRVCEMIPALATKLSRNETLFLIFDGAMIILAVGCVTVFHPCFFFKFMGKGNGKVRGSQTHLEPISYQSSRLYEPSRLDGPPPYGRHQEMHSHRRSDAFELGSMR